MMVEAFVRQPRLNPVDNAGRRSQSAGRRGPKDRIVGDA